MSSFIEPQASAAHSNPQALLTLLEAIARREHRAMRDLHVAVATHVYLTALASVGSPDRAREIVGYVLAYVWNAAHLHDARSESVLEWITRATSRCARELPGAALQCLPVAAGAAGPEADALASGLRPFPPPPLSGRL
jgi:hypothetical protein